MTNPDLILGTLSGSGTMTLYTYRDTRKGGGSKIPRVNDTSMTMTVAYCYSRGLDD